MIGRIKREALNWCLVRSRAEFAVLSSELVRDSLTQGARNFEDLSTETMLYELEYHIDIVEYTPRVGP
jgi:hypothetical protein